MPTDWAMGWIFNLTGHPALCVPSGFESDGTPVSVTFVGDLYREQDIARAAGAPAELFNCCIDTGEEALNTRGNALEAASWVGRNRYSTVIVVTNDFHMPRALLELQAAMPDTRLIAYAAPTPPPWSSPGEARRWLQEYAKYAAVFVRERIGVMDADGV